MFRFCLECFNLFLLLCCSVANRNKMQTKGNANIKEMKIPTKILLNWKRYYSHGDVKKISEITKKSRPTITRALSGNDASPELIAEIDGFYQQRKESISSLSKQ